MKGKVQFLFIYCIVNFINLYSQTGKAFQFETSYTGDVVNNFTGGIRTGANYLGMLSLKFSFKPEQAGLWNGGTFFIQAVNTHGQTPAANLTGDFQGLTNIEAGNLTYIHELWYKQRIGDFALTAGLQDLCTEFAASVNASLFLNSSFGVHSTISDNVPAPIFPLTALGILLSVDLPGQTSLRLSVFDGLPDDFESNPHNLRWKLSSDDGIFSIAELDFPAEFFGLEGTYKMGGYYHNHISIEDNPTEKYINNYGLYLVSDVLIYKEPGGDHTGFFFQAGVSPAARNENNIYLGSGLTYTGLFKGRDNDIVGIGIAYAGLKTRSDETVVEISYRAQITANITIQPDIQYIFNASGTDSKLRNPIAGILRTIITY